jgi:beta-ureidopropionase / N-carbamoyl-L-amino-acid hydrolase
MRLEIDRERLRADIEANAAFGETKGEGRGRTNLTGSEANRQAREHLVSRMEEAGLEVRIDAVGNIVGHWTPEGVSGTENPVASGSHLDSVPEGGIFDGPLGVYAALESVRAMQEVGLFPERPIAVVSFTEEEGQLFAPGLLGSSVAVGERSVEEALSLTDGEGRSLEEALEGIGFHGEGRLDASGWEAFVELHVEQHDRLETMGIPVGIVTAITGITHCTVSIEGEANHAGATPMGGRRDALCAASEFVLDVERASLETVAADSESAVGTVGSLDVRPNATNVVPGGVELSVDVRDVEYDSMDAIVGRAERSLARIERERGVATTLDRGFDLEPTPMSPRVREAARAAGEAAGITTMELHSGAAHDAMHVARATDVGMLFAPSRDGVSHSPREWTDWEDCARATRVLAGTLARLAGATP